MANFTGILVPLDASLSTYDSPSATMLMTSSERYAQRVWSTGGGGFWCYYVSVINASPASTDTTPNWVGSSVRHEVLGLVRL